MAIGNEVVAAKIAVKAAMDEELKAFKKLQNAEVKLNKAKRDVRIKLEHLEGLVDYDGQIDYM